MFKIMLKFFKGNTSASPYLIVGLGNPGKEYRDNRHNVGFRVIDEFANRNSFELRRVRFEAIIEKTIFEERSIVLAKPRTFMNRSGISVAAMARFYKSAPEQILVIFDDVDLDFGRIRLLPRGGSSGQKGMKSIIERLGTQDFPRLRVGVGRPRGKKSTPNHVLQDFSKQEKAELPFVLDRAAKAVEEYLISGLDAAMNTYNQKNDE